MCSKWFPLVHAGFNNLDPNSVSKGRACLVLGRQNTQPSHQLLKPRNPTKHIRMGKSHPGQQGEAAALLGTGATAPCNTNVHERQLQHMEHPEGKNPTQLSSLHPQTWSILRIDRYTNCSLCNPLQK